MGDPLNIPDLGNFDYTFTNRELEDVLGFIERRQSGMPNEMHEEDHSLPFFRPEVPQLGLQFQPRPVPEEGATEAALPTTSPPPSSPQFLPCAYDDAFPQSIGSIMEAGSVGASQPMFHVPAGNTSRATAAATTQLAAMPVPMPVSSITIPRPPPPPAASAQPPRRGEGKAPVSHSTVEKQRRDRINALIDELRELVPPQAGDREAQYAQQEYASHGQISAAEKETRRPKHAVLADTIALVRDLRSQLAAVQLHSYTTTQQPQHGASGTSPPLTHRQEGPEAAAAAAAVAVAAAAAAASPLSASAPGPEGVEIAPGEGCMYVKVHCKDRHGLLSDIVRTLKAIPLEITTAAITTTATGNVYDVFQVVPAPGTPTTTAEQIKDSVVAAMHNGHAPNDDTTSEKKRRAR